LVLSQRFGFTSSLVDAVQSNLLPSLTRT